MVAQFIPSSSVRNPHRVIVFATNPTARARQQLDVLIDRSKPQRQQIEAIVLDWCGKDWEVLPGDWVPTGDCF